MKERILLLIFAVSSILVGCTNDGADNAPVVETPSDVPILLNAKGLLDIDVTESQKSSATRASVDSKSDLEAVGIYMLAAKKTGINGSMGTDGAKDIDWRVEVDPGADYATTTNGVYWKNMRCTLDAETDYLVKDNDDIPLWYYPITSWYAYDFYGYHPYQEDGFEMTQYATGKYRITVDFEIKVVEVEGQLQVIKEETALISEYDKWFYDCYNNALSYLCLRTDVDTAQRYVDSLFTTS